MKKLFLEISSLAFYTNNTKPFSKSLRDLKIDNTERMLRKYSEVAIRASFYLYVCKNKEWLSPKLLTFNTRKHTYTASTFLDYFWPLQHDLQENYSWVWF